MKKTKTAQKPEMSEQAKKYALCYQLYFKKASDVTRAKLLTLKEDPDNIVSKDADIQEFLKNVIELAETDLETPNRE